MMITNMSVATGFAVGFGLVSLWMMVQLIAWINGIAEEDSYRKRTESASASILLLPMFFLLVFALAFTITAMIATEDANRKHEAFVKTHNVCKVK